MIGRNQAQNHAKVRSMKIPVSLLGLLLLQSVQGIARAETTPPLPPGDKPGSADSPALKRFEGSIILSYEKKNLDEVSWPLSKLEWVPKQKNSGNNDVAAPKKKKDLTGERTTLLYVTPPERSPLEALKSYKDQITEQKGKVLYECKAADCGGKPTGNSLDGGSRMSLAMYLRSAEKVQEKPWSVPWCAAQVGLTDVRYLVAELPAAGATVSVMAASPTTPNTGACGSLAGRRSSWSTSSAGRPAARSRSRRVARGLTLSPSATHRRRRRRPGRPTPADRRDRRRGGRRDARRRRRCCGGWRACR